MVVIAILIAVLLDWLLGDPYSWPHPVKLIGHLIAFLQKYHRTSGWKSYAFGLCLWLVTVGVTCGVTYLLLWGASQVHSVLYWIVWIYLAYTCLATRSLAFEANKIIKTLKTGTLEEARYQVSMIVGRDTSQLSPEEISKATIETVAENTSDGVIGPMLCLFIGGPVLAMTYKAINTLDSMVGYKTVKYKEIGFVSAKIDDLVNLIPARLTWLCLVLASHVLQLDGKNALKIGWRDRYQHSSPNSAFTEAVVAGALGIQLGGTHVYHGQIIEKPTIGDKKRVVVVDDITTTVSLLYMSTTLAVILLSLLYLTIY